MTRFWINLPQAVNFVLSSLTMLGGGEIFVPKIPSMKVTDIARVLAPGVPQYEVGIRPGEKLHEIMITEESGRDTMVLEDRYIVEPAFAFWRRERYLKRGAEEAPAGLCYSSDKNDEWLNDEDFTTLLAQADIPRP